MNKQLRCSFGLAIATLASGLGLAWGQSAAPPQAPTGYLTSSQMPDVVRIVPVAPATGDSRFTADMAIYRATRSLQGSPRWALAQADDDVSTAGLFKAFRCPLGVALTRDNAPLVTRLVMRANADSSKASTVLKQFYQHKRPFQVTDGPVCVTPQDKAELAQNPDYPSGHTTAAWETGLVLSELAPDAATALLARARAFGESRIVCGVHNTSAVQAGWMTATAVFAAQHGSAAFRDDMDRARAELVAVRKSPAVDAAACAKETETLAKDPF
jgi:acid phosphatase (class A)